MYPEQVENAENFEVEDEDLRETKNVSIYNHYHETWIDAEEETVREAIENKTYNENERWINTLLETYKDTELTREKRGSLAKRLSRKILELKNSSIPVHQSKQCKLCLNPSVSQLNFMILGFKSFLDTYHQLTVKGIEKIFMAFIENNHVYPIKDNQDRLFQLKGEKPLDFSASQNFEINDKTEPPKNKMFSHKAALLKLSEEDDLVYKNYFLNEVLFQLERAGYEPYIRYRAGVVSELRIRFY